MKFLFLFAVFGLGFTIGRIVEHHDDQQKCYIQLPHGDGPCMQKIRPSLDGGEITDEMVCPGVEK